MRSSDWMSDVCSSDLVVLEHVEGIDVLAGRDVAQREGRTDASDAEESVHWLPGLTARPQCAKARATASRASNRIGSRPVTFSAIAGASVASPTSMNFVVRWPNQLATFTPKRTSPSALAAPAAGSGEGFRAEGRGVGKAGASKGRS